MISTQFHNFDTVNQISIPTSDNAEALDSVRLLCIAYERLFSRFSPDSEISRLNRSLGSWVFLSEDTLRLLREGEQIRRLSGGAFNLLTGAVSSLWYSDGEGRVPAETDAASAARRAQNSRIEFGGGGRARILGDAQADAGGIAKGYIADRLVESLSGRGIENALINLGGNIAAMGRQENGAPWLVGVRDPEGGRNDILAAIPVTDKSVVTSGVYERCFYINGQRCHHIIDPATGFPADNNVLSVTVVSRSSLLADALSTALLVLGPERAEPLLREFPDTEVLYVLSDGSRLASEGLELLRPDGYGAHT